MASSGPCHLIWRPEFFAAMNETDALSEALRSVRLTGAIFFDAELGAPWGFASPPVREAGRTLALAAEHVVLFHLVTAGYATARVKGQDDVRLEAGDILVVAQGDAHELWNGQGAARIDTSSLLPKILSGAIVSERGGGGGAITRFVCGYIRCEQRAGGLYLAGLPPLFRVNVRKDVSGEWIESSIRHLASESESKRPGRTALLAKLAEALFIEALRRYMSELPPERTGWLAAARDQAVGSALASLHRDPARAWTVAELAKQAGLSRTVFAQRFGRLLEVSPLAYLARWRMQLGARLLETTDDTVLQIALTVGYESEPAFNRAFKREFQIPPARYRQQQRTGR